MNRNRLIVGLVTFAVIIVFVTAVFLFREANSRKAQVGQRLPIPSLRYCSSNQLKPCILSFNLNADGSMSINMLIDSSSPRFYIKIRHPLGENIYQCRPTQGGSSSVSCIGKAMPVGEILHFLMISRNKNITLAEGHFPIIGLALATPEIAPTQTSETPFTPLATSDFFTMTPTAIEVPPDLLFTRTPHFRRRSSK